MWYYDKSDTGFNRKTIHQFDWLRTLSNVNVNEKRSNFTKLLLDVIHKENEKLSDEKAYKSYYRFHRNMFLSKNLKSYRITEHINERF